jgi:hypothetical protein
MLTKEEFFIIRDVMRFKSRPLEGANEKKLVQSPSLKGRLYI